MTKAEILKTVIESHNILAQMYVANDNVILLGDVLIRLRNLGAAIEADLNAERPTEDESRDGGGGE